jgi:type I restriction enzyme S subunit
MSWHIKTIEEITEVVTKGTTPSTYGMPFTEEGINFIKAEALNGDVTLDRSGFTFIADETHEKLKRSQLQENDVLITIAGANVGKCGFVRQNDIPANTNQAVGIVRVNPTEANPRYIYYHFKQQSTFAMCQGIGGGQAAQPNINLTVLKGFKVRLPDTQRQDRIVEIIGAYDDLIENNKRRIELLEEAARQLYKEWFVRFRFPGHEHVKIIDGVPHGWEKKTIGEISQTVGGGTPSTAVPEYWDDGDITWFVPKDLTQNDSLVLLDSEKKITKLGLQKSSAKLLPPNTIMMSSRASIGYFGRAIASSSSLNIQ